LSGERISAADRYEPVDDLALVTTYFNPAGFLSKRRIYADFAERIEASGLALTTIECAFGDRDFELPDADGVVRVRARDVMWQKERLVNLAVAGLPARFRKVAWIDFDVMFENAAWAVEASRMLEEAALVQPFERAVWLPKGATSYCGKGDVWLGLAATHAADPAAVAAGDFYAHGHPGFVWAARRELVERHGLYDACVIGGADHLIAHAACGDWASTCFEWTLGRETAHHRHFARWAEAFHADAGGRVAFVPGTLLHVWHGRWERRNYTFRHKELKSFGFDPERDVRAVDGGALEWASEKPEMHAWASAYFALRDEDDRPEQGRREATDDTESTDPTDRSV
jgi:hypothetical protein